MLHLIKMDLYRLVHSASAWVIVAAAALLAVFCIAMTNLDIQAMEDSAETAIAEDSDFEERAMGIYVSTDSNWLEQVEAGSVISAQVQSGILALLCAIFTAIFINAEQKNGFIKNIAGQFPKRGKLIASKLAAIAVQVFLVILVFSAAAAAAGDVFWHGKFYMGSMAALLKFLGIQYLLHLGFAALIMFLCVLTKSTAFSMTVGIVAGTGLFTPLYSVINKLINDIWPGWNFNINRYVLDSNITAVGIDSVPSIMLRGAIVALAFLAAATFCAMLLMKKRDVR